MTRYDLIVKKVDGCASAKVEKHELGSFVKYVDVVERIAELEGSLIDIYMNELGLSYDDAVELEATLESVNECFGGLYVKKQIEKLKEQGE